MDIVAVPARLVVSPERSSVHLTQALSRHRTSEGTIVYGRCDCGQLLVWLESRNGIDRLVTSSPSGTAACPAASRAGGARLQTTR